MPRILPQPFKSKKSLLKASGYLSLLLFLVPLISFPLGLAQLPAQDSISWRGNVVGAPAPDQDGKGQVMVSERYRLSGKARKNHRVVGGVRSSSLGGGYMVVHDASLVPADALPFRGSGSCPCDGALFEDGFESGSTSAWSSTQQ